MTEFLDTILRMIQVGLEVRRRLRKHRNVGVPVWTEGMDRYARFWRKRGYSYPLIASMISKRFGVRVGVTTVYDHVGRKGRYRLKGLRAWLRF